MLFGLATGARAQPDGSVASNGRLHGTHLEGRESNRSAGGAVDQVRFCDQSEDAKALGIEVPPTRANEVIE